MRKFGFGMLVTFCAIFLVFNTREAYAKEGKSLSVSEVRHVEKIVKESGLHLTKMERLADSDTQVDARSEFVKEGGNASIIPIEVKTYKIWTGSQNLMGKKTTDGEGGTQYLTVARAERKGVHDKKHLGGVVLEASFIWVDYFGPDNYMTNFSVHRYNYEKGTVAKVNYGDLLFSSGYKSETYTGNGMTKNVYIKGLKLGVDASTPTPEGSLKLHIENNVLQ